MGSRIETCPTGERSPLYEDHNNFTEKIEKRHIRNANTEFEEKYLSQNKREVFNIFIRGFIWLDNKENNEEHDEHKSNLLKAKIANAKRFRNRKFVQSKEYDTLEDVTLANYFTSAKRQKSSSNGLDANGEQIEGSEQQNEEGSNSEESYSSRFELTSRNGSQNEIK